MKKKSRSSGGRLRSFLLVVMTATLCAVIAVFAGYWRSRPMKEGLNASVKKGVGLSMDRVRQTASKNGKLEWSLQALEVSYVNSKRAAVFQSPEVTFFYGEDQRAVLKADAATVETESSNIAVTGHVILDNGQYKLKTESLTYLHDQGRFSSDRTVRITGGEMELSAESAAFNLKEGRLVFQGNVRGTFGEGMHL